MKKSEKKKSRASVCVGMCVCVVAVLYVCVRVISCLLSMRSLSNLRE